MNENFFTAAEAKQKSMASLNAKLENELELIYKKINEATGLGQTQCIFYNKPLSKEAKDFLESKGYKVSVWRGDQRDPYNDITISWGEV